MTKILVTGAGALLGQGIIKSLRACSLKTTIISVDPNPLSVGLYWTDGAHLVPMASAPGYMEQVEALLRLERPDVVMVGTDTELPYFAAHRERLEREYSLHVLVSSPQVVEIADDKWQTAQFFKAHGFDYPDSALPGTPDVERLLETFGFPLLVKPRRGARSIGVGVVKNRDELAYAIEHGDNVVIQEYIGTANDEYTAGALTFDGETHATIVMRRDLRDGNTYRAYVEAYPELNAAVRAMATRLQPYGPANFQFRIDKAGRVKVFEINARFSGTTPLRMRAGFNEVEMALRYLLYGEPIIQPKVEPMIMLRYWEETVIRQHDVERVKGGER